MQSPTGKREVCQVPGCLADLSTEAKRYCWHKRICSKHMQDETLVMPTPEGGVVLCRFCFQCGKLHHLTQFDGKQKSCRAKLCQRRDRFKAARRAGAAAAAEARAAAMSEQAVAAAVAAVASAAAACSTLAFDIGSPHVDRASTEDLNLMQQQQQQQEQPLASAESFDQLLCQLIEEELGRLLALPDTPAAAGSSSLSCPAAHHGFEPGWLQSQQPPLGASFPSSSSFGSINSQADAAAAPWGAQQQGHSPAAACPWAGEGSGDLSSRMPLLRLGSHCSAPDLLNPDVLIGAPLASTAAAAATAGGGGGIGTPAATTAAAAAALSAGFFEPGAFQASQSLSQQVGCSTQPFAATAALQHPLLAPPPSPAAAGVAGAGVLAAGLTSADGLSCVMPPQAALAHIQGHSAQPALSAAPPLPPALPLAMPQQQQQQQSWEQQQWQERERQRECYRSLAAQLATMEANLKSLEHTLTAAISATSATT